MAKRALKFEDDLDQDMSTEGTKLQKLKLTPKKIKSTESHATVEGAITAVSPSKNNSSFFDGELTDGHAVIRVVGFDRAQHSTLREFQTKGLPVTLTNCVIQANKLSKKLEIVLKGYTQIELSNTKFDLSEVATVGSDTIFLSSLPNKKDFDKVTVRIKVVRIGNPESVGRNKTKQDISISDATANACLTIWEQDIGKFQIGLSYQLNRFNVRSYRGKQHLSFPPSGASFSIIDDIGEVVGDSFDADSEDSLIEGVKIVGVYQLETIYTCFHCKKGNVKPDNNTYGTCANCEMAQVLKDSKLTAKLFLETHDIAKHVTVRAYEDIMKTITDPEEITTSTLLESPPFDARYNEYHVLTGISRQ